MQKRKTLTNRSHPKRLIDMEAVYRQLDSGRSVKSVAEEWDVSISTLYRRHNEYQKELEAVADDVLPPLPDEESGYYNGKL